MGYSQNDSHDFYHDDPIEEISKTKSRFKFLTTGAIILGSIFYFQSTLAGNISLSSGTGLDFGQGFSQAVACSGNTDLTLTPRSTFINGSPGAHYLNSVTVSGIPDSCFGVDFTINAYGNTENSPLALFNSTSTAAVVSDEAGTFSRGTGSKGMTVASSTGTFTVTFTTPVAQSSEVFKVTIQSGAHTPFYDVGSAGPGGGIVYYVSDEGFNCGPTYTSTGSPTGGLCHYLEVAPSGWKSGKSGDLDPYMPWATEANHFKAVKSIEYVNINCWVKNPSICLAGSAVGIGYKNSVAIVKQGNGITTSAGVALAYRGGSLDDWYLPSLTELNNLLKWAQGVPWKSNTTVVTGGETNSSVYGATAAKVDAYGYSSSTEMYRDSSHTGNRPKYAHNVSFAMHNYFKYDTLKIAGVEKTDNNYSRPIRAF